MRICNCALPALRGNSDCCRLCGNNHETLTTSSFKIITYEPYIQPTKKEIIDKFDELGKITERIIRDI
jgi:hypothetical protein